MTSPFTLLTTRLGKKITVLFVLCALGPLALISVLSLFHVRHQLLSQAKASLHEETKLQGMAIISRLRLLEAELRMLTEMVVHAPDADALLDRYHAARQDTGFLRLLRIAPVEGVLAVQGLTPTTLSEEQQTHLATGGNLLMQLEGDEPELFMVLKVPDEDATGTLLCASLDPDHLLAGSAQESQEGLAFCVLGAQGQVPLVVSAAFSGELATDERWRGNPNFNGEFTWSSSDGEEHLVRYWRIFLKPVFIYPGMTLIRQMSMDDVYAPASFFRAMFVPAILLAFWIALLTSMMLIRRNLVPLKKLQEATQHVARRDFAHRVDILSKDEFADLGSSFNTMSDQLERQFQTLKTITQIDRAILSSLKLETVVAHILEGLEDLFACRFCAVTILDPGIVAHPETHVRTAGGAVTRSVAQDKPGADALSSINTLPAVSVFEKNEAIPDVTRKHLPALAEGRCLVMTTRGKQGVVASIAIAAFDADRTLSDDDRAQAEQLVNQIGVALSNIKLLADLERMGWGAIEALSRAVDAKSHWTAGHSERVTRMALALARKLGHSAAQLEVLHRGGLLHDIGKLSISSTILDKTSRLDADEYTLVRSHTVAGRRIVQPIEAFAEIIPIIEQHHERVDGKGYPHGLAGDDIDFNARILAVADVFDAISADRPYREGQPLEKVLELIEMDAGKHFDPKIVAAFVELVKEGGLPGFEEAGLRLADSSVTPIPEPEEVSA